MDLRVPCSFNVEDLMRPDVRFLLYLFPLIASLSCTPILFLRDLVIFSSRRTMISFLESYSRSLDLSISLSHPLTQLSDIFLDCFRVYPGVRNFFRNWSTTSSWSSPHASDMHFPISRPVHLYLEFHPELILLTITLVVDNFLKYLKSNRSLPPLWSCIQAWVTSIPLPSLPQW